MGATLDGARCNVTFEHARVFVVWKKKNLMFHTIMRNLALLARKLSGKPGRVKNNQ